MPSKTMMVRSARLSNCAHHCLWRERSFQDTRRAGISHSPPPPPLLPFPTDVAMPHVFQWAWSKETKEYTFNLRHQNNRSSWSAYLNAQVTTGAYCLFTRVSWLFLTRYAFHPASWCRVSTPRVFSGAIRFELRFVYRLSWQQLR